MKKLMIGLAIVMIALGIIGAMAIRESNNTLERTQWVESEVNR